MSPKTKRSFFRNFWQFVRLQLAGNVLFWGTYVGYAVGDKLVKAESWKAIAVASICAHVLFFLLNKNWVFSTKTGKAKTGQEIVRFVLFMGLNFFINLGIVLGLERYLQLTPYVGQFVAGAFFAVWTWLGLKFWVFRGARHAHHHAITIETRKSNAKRHATYQRLAAKQKAKRTT